METTKQCNHSLIIKNVFNINTLNIATKHLKMTSILLKPYHSLADILNYELFIIFGDIYYIYSFDKQYEVFILI